MANVTRIRSIDDLLVRCVPIPDTGCFLWEELGFKDGYGQVRWRGITCRTHRVSWELAHGSIPQGMHVLHRCDTPKCCWPGHLFLGTHADNMRDREQKGRAAAGPRNGSRLYPGRLIRGEAHPLARLTAQKAREIRSMYEAGGLTATALATRFGITKQSVLAVIHFRTWKTA